MMDKKTFFKYLSVILLTGIIVGYTTYWFTAHAREDVLLAAMKESADKAVHDSKMSILSRIEFDTNLYGMSCWRSTFQSEGLGAEHVEADTWANYSRYANPTK